jgi:hypothetical protein
MQKNPAAGFILRAGKLHSAANHCSGHQKQVSSHEAWGGTESVDQPTIDQPPKMPDRTNPTPGITFWRSWLCSVNAGKDSQAHLTLPAWTELWDRNTADHNSKLFQIPAY